ncbi:MAG: cephalosporin hydroxylase family protein [Gemmatimonadaceae bacterium]
MAADPTLAALTTKWFNESCRHRYSYNFTWLGLPIIQFPQDMVAMQELVWRVKPDLVVETGVARGGSLAFYASLLELLRGDGRVVGIDIDIRPANREAIESHALAKRITLVDGSSTDERTVVRVRELARGRERVLVVLDSNHTHDHVLRELELYSPLVRAGSYVVVFDTVVERMPAEAFPDRPWGPGNNPMTAVREFLARNDRFTVDEEIENKLLITVAPRGYLRCVRD